MIAYFYPKLGANRWTPPSLHGKAIKGHEDLIRAAPLVLREFPNANFHLATLAPTHRDPCKFWEHPFYDQ